MKTDRGNQQLLEMVEVATFGNKSDITVMCDNNSLKFRSKIKKGKRSKRGIKSKLFCGY